MSSPTTSERPPLSGWAQDRWNEVRAGVQGTFADRRRRLRLIRTTAIWTVLAAGVAVFAYEFSWDWFRGPVAHYASARTGRDVRVLGHLHVHPFSWTPWASVDGVTVGNPKWMGPGQTANLGRTTVQLALKPLLKLDPKKRALILPLLDIERPTVSLYADSTGRNNWTFGKGGGQAKLPLIQHFVLRDGALHIRDEQRKLTFDGTVTTTENAGKFSAEAFHLQGKGALNAAPFLAEITGGPLVHVQKDRPYPFNMDVHSAFTHVVARGQVTRPFDLGRLEAAVDVSGRDLADLYHLTGVVLPNTPAYLLSGDFTREGQLYRIRHFAGRVGRSDLEGALQVQPVKGRKFLKADLSSRTLDFTDLGALFGGPQAGKSAALEKAAMQAQKTSTGRLLPDAPLDVERVRVMDADLRYHAQSVKAPGLPLRQVGLHLTLDHGLLKLDPVDFTFPRGQVRGRAAIDARGKVPVDKVDFAVTDLHLEDLIPKRQGAAPLQGVMEARAQLSGAGNTVHRAAAASNGRIAVAVPPGKMNKGLAELMGVNVVPGLFEVLTKDPKPTNLRCMVADFDVRNGVLTARNLVIDTDVVVTDGKGSVNLGSESVDFTLKGHTKKPRLIRVIAPFRIQGQLAKPRFSVEKGGAIAQAGVAVGLGAVLSPIAAIIPFISLGGAHDANCAGLLSQARSAGAPVKTIHIAEAMPVKKR
jgi:uncharacterized protein involved in outer membrane biogenesis